MGTVLKVMLGLLLAFVVLIVGCVALFGSAAEEVTREQQENAITDAQARGLPLGTRRRAVIERFGRPASTQESESEGLGRSGCIYYNRADGEFGENWQFCFEQGRLRSKNRL